MNEGKLVQSCFPQQSAAISSEVKVVNTETLRKSGSLIVSMAML